MKRSQLVKVIKEELGRKQPLNENLDAIITKYIETDDATELKAYFKSLPDKARTKLAKIFKIDLNEMTQTTFIRIQEYTEIDDREEQAEVWEGLLLTLKETVGG